MDDLPSYRCAFSDGEDVILKVLPRLELLTQNSAPKLSMTPACLKEIVSHDISFASLSIRSNLLLNLTLFQRRVSFSEHENFDSSQVSSLSKMVELMGGVITGVADSDLIISNKAEKGGDSRYVSPAYINYLANTDKRVSFHDFIRPMRSLSTPKASSQKVRRDSRKDKKEHNFSVLSSKQHKSKRLVNDGDSKTIFDCGLFQYSQMSTSSTDQATAQEKSSLTLKSELERLNKSTEKTSPQGLSQHLKASQEQSQHLKLNQGLSQQLKASQGLSQQQQHLKLNQGISQQLKASQEQHSKIIHERTDIFSRGSSPVTTQASQVEHSPSLSLINPSQKKTISFNHAQIDSFQKPSQGQMKIDHFDYLASSGTMSLSQRKNGERKNVKTKQTQLNLTGSLPKRSDSSPKLVMPQEDKSSTSQKQNKQIKEQHPIKPKACVPVPVPSEEDIDAFSQDKIDVARTSDLLKKLCSDLVTFRSPKSVNHNAVDADLIMNFSQRPNPQMLDEDQMLLSLDEDTLKKSQNEGECESDEKFISLLSSNNV